MRLILLLFCRRCKIKIDINIPILILFSLIWVIGIFFIFILISDIENTQNKIKNGYQSCAVIDLDKGGKFKYLWKKECDEYNDKDKIKIRIK